MRKETIKAGRPQGARRPRLPPFQASKKSRPPQSPRRRASSAETGRASAAVGAGGWWFRQRVGRAICVQRTGARPWLGLFDIPFVGWHPQSRFYRSPERKKKEPESNRANEGNGGLDEQTTGPKKIRFPQQSEGVLSGHDKAKSEAEAFCER